MTDRSAKRLRDALAACRAIAAFTDGADFSGYEENELLRSGVERKLEIVGEALKYAEDEDATLGERITELRGIVGPRNRIIHGYDAVDDEIIWDIVQSKVPTLVAQLEAVLEERNEQEK
jgi:uncharacterized protein with HEPN domain